MEKYEQLLSEAKDAGEDWMVYRILIDLFGLPAGDVQVVESRIKMVAHPLIQGLIEEMKEWPGAVLNSHKSAGQLYHKLSFLADLGIEKDDGLEFLAKKITAHQSEESLLQLPMNIPTHFGGSGMDEWAWALCDAPILMQVAVRMGYISRELAAPGVEYMASLVRDNGWPCTVSKNLGKFRGPGKKSDPCPYATLIMLKLLQTYGGYEESIEVKAGVSSLLQLWENSRKQHPYMFFMGTDFRKLKAPLIWYDILHVADVLAMFKDAKNDQRFTDMVSVLLANKDEKGWYTPQSEWKAWKGWEFAQKKKPSLWITYLVWRIEKRFQEKD